MTSLRAVKGMNDVLPAQIAGWHRVEAAFRRCMELSGFREVRTPHVESTALFQRAIGEVTDVVEKEMYSFAHHEDRLTLRPEGTAGVVRAYIEHRVHNTEPVTRWYYMGPMFRAETPQAGRYRQFHQYGAELFGDPGPAGDAEMISELMAFLAACGVADARVYVNSIGGPEARASYTRALVSFLEPRKERLGADSRRRLATNPLRILDSKAPEDLAALEGAPTILELLSAEDRAHFSGLCAHLDALGVPHEVEPKLVRGLDYYTRTLFEIKGARKKLGAGDTLVGGGRYDRMVEELGGPKVAAFGYAGGLERLLIAAGGEEGAPHVSVLLTPVIAAATGEALKLARELRASGVPCEVDTRGSSLKSMLRRANGLGASFAMILGESELEEGVVQVKDLAGHTQERIARADVVRVVGDRVLGARSA